MKKFLMWVAAAGMAGAAYAQNTSSVLQTGHENDAVVVQAGANASEIDQQGHANLAFVNQIGLANYSEVSQMGMGNEAEVLQTGALHQAYKEQHGMGNSATSTQWGFGNLAFQFQHKPYSEETGKLIDEEVRKLVEECYNEAKDLLTCHKKELTAIAQLLLEKEIVYRDDLERILGKRNNYPIPQLAAGS